jgi:predicted nucleic acid binding AN1-type Zn finger protein
MPKCLKCRKKSIMPFICKYCKLNFCSGCILVETHECSEMEACRNHKKKILKKTLESQKCIGAKFVTI